MSRLSIQRCVALGRWILGGVLIGAVLDLLLVETPVRRQLTSIDEMRPVASAEQKEPQSVHIVFSTGCSPSQDWQSYAFFFHAVQVRQPGEITRIVAGCNETQQAELARRHQEQIVDKMSNKFHIHFTPDYSNLGSGMPYKYFNKPFGLRHWMENAMAFPNNSTEATEKIIAVLDPDMILLKPLVNDFSTLPTEAWNEGQLKRPIQFQVKKGFPIAQEYSYSSHWRHQLDGKMKEIIGEKSRVHYISDAEAAMFYPAGPPYIITAQDLYDVVLLWTKIVPDVHRHYPDLLGEMFGYSIAAAHLGLKHQLALGLMISNPDVDREGWQFLQDVAPQDLALHRPKPAELPNVLHYCQNYAVGNFFVSKYYIPDNFLTCEAPLLLEVSNDAVMKSDFYRNSKGTKMKFASKKHAIRNTLLATTLATSLNQAATFYKRNHCGSTTANYNKSWSRF
jgi:hypothetical protein